jgi:hypothetical protein
MALKLKSKKQMAQTFAKINNSLVEVGQNEITTPDFYVRVNIVQGSKLSVQASVEFLNFETRLLVFNQRHIFEPNMDGDNFIRQAYKYLKTLPEFANAEDC